MIGATAVADPGGLLAIDALWTGGQVVTSPPLVASWTVQRLASGDVAFQLSAGYQLQLAALDRNLTLIDLARDVRTTITHDARVLTDVGTIGAFYAPISLELGDGTLVTITTATETMTGGTQEPAVTTWVKGFVATRDTMAMQVASLVDALIDPGAATQVSANGDDVDEGQGDGLVLVQDRAGWLQEDGITAADAAYLAQTAPDGAFGGDNPSLSGREVGRIIHRLIALGTLGQSTAALYRAPDRREDRSRDAAERAVARQLETQRMAELAAFQRRMLL